MKECRACEKNGRKIIWLDENTGEIYLVAKLTEDNSMLDPKKPDYVDREEFLIRKLFANNSARR